ncbi:Eco57I restriction-modification methylase domain-containing protein [Nakamurella deserti]|uniref:Eco57I restriction-modification methylase domain-containing protein n=1 Tax=Nakamurella deserti TaxID=2164074 RepID=UPI001300BE32|nr:SAM-dependent DNA methyltransferase [Nakamurella deserti]
MKPKTPTVTELHKDWLAQIETDGPFLALPVVKDIWPQGVDRLGDADDRTVTFKQAYVQWQRAFDTYTADSKSADARADYKVVNRAWIELVLDRLAGWQDLRLDADDQRLSALRINSPGGEITVRPSGALEGRDGELAVLVLSGDPTSDLRTIGLDGWAATEIDRMAALLRQARVEVGIVTDGQWWAIVWAKDGKPTGSGIVNALTWAEEPLLRDAFLTLIDQRRFRAKDAEQRLPRLFERSELEAEEITEALGTQVRRSVELLVQAFSEARLAAAAAGEPDPLTDEPDAIYQGAVTVMMRVVFLLFAEEREMLPTEQLYWDSYAIRDLLQQLKTIAADGEERLDTSFNAWHRLLAVSNALFSGVNYDEMRIPAYGGSLLDPARFPWLDAVDHRGNLRLIVSDRVMLHVFDSVQSVDVSNDRRLISFREIDVEQIGYIYEGLLGYTCQIVTGDVVLGLVGKNGQEPEIPLQIIEGLYQASDIDGFAASLVNWFKVNQPAAIGPSAGTINKLLLQGLNGDKKAELIRLLTPIAGSDPVLMSRLVRWGSLIRRDLRRIPLVLPVGGLVVIETPSRKDAGAHYTPRILAQDVVKHALEPLVYEPGAWTTADKNLWKVKSSTAILDLRVVDIAVGSGAFLVAAARFLADRVAEAWTREGNLSKEERTRPNLAVARAIREVIARCLYGADINPMAVDMCKLSLWLISMDKAKPFSFVDDKIFCGNSLFGLTSLNQLRAVHIYPETQGGGNLLHEIIDVDGRVAEAVRLKQELASPVDEHDPMRSTRSKLSLMNQAQKATEELSLIADGIVAVALHVGGKPGTQLNAKYVSLSLDLARALQDPVSTGSRNLVEKQIDGLLTPETRTDYKRWRPLHWILQAPQILVERGGFDAIIGNPAFLHSKKISTAYGVNYRSYLQAVLANGIKGNADLAAFFLLRQAQLARKSSIIGLVVTKSIQQSATRLVGLEQILRKGADATISQPFDWGSGEASVSVVRFWLRLREDSTEHTVTEPIRPPGVRPVNAFVGTYPNGEGFRVSAGLAASWMEEEKSLSEVLYPYVRAGDLSIGDLSAPSEWIIDVHGLPEKLARTAGPAWDHLEQFQRPWRQQPSTKPRLKEHWWWFEAAADKLYGELSSVDRCIVLPRTSNLLMPRFASASLHFDMGVVVFPYDSMTLWGQIASSLHYHWTLSFAATTRDDPSYAPRRVSDTFPWLHRSRTDLAATEAFEASLERGCLEAGGLRPLMNMFNSQNHVGASITELRDSFIRMDKEVLGWYGWNDIHPQYSVRKRNNLHRFTIDDDSRVELLERLLRLNHDRSSEK